MPLSVPGLPGLPPDLAGPVAVELAKPVRSIPPEGALPGGCVYEPKWDGYRLVVVRDGASTRLWSKQGRDLTALFPEIVAAAVAQVPPGTVLDGEVVIWNGSRLDFGILQLRMVTPAGRIGTLAAANPASYVAFDLLAAGAADLRGRNLAGRRSALEDLAGRWAPPLQLSPATSDRTEAQRWFDDFPPRRRGGPGRQGRGHPLRAGPTGVAQGQVLGDHGGARWWGDRPGGAAQPTDRRPLPGRRAGRGGPYQPAHARAGGRAGRRPPSRRGGPPLAGTRRHRALRRGQAVRAAHPRRPIGGRGGERGRRPAGGGLPVPAALRPGAPRPAPGGPAPDALIGHRGAQRTVSPRRTRTRRSSGAKTSSSIATPTTRINAIEVITSDICDSSRPMLSS